MKNQIAKFASGAGTGNSKVLAFNLSCSTGEDNKSGNPLEISALNRLSVEAHYPVNGEMQHVIANLPIAELPALIELSKQALLNQRIWKEEGTEIELYHGIWKPKTSSKNENGETLCYFLSVNYDSSKNSPIVVTVENGWANVQTRDDGRLNTNLKSIKDKKSVSFYVSAEDWYNKMTLAMESFLSYRTALTTRGTYDVPLGIITEVSAQSDIA